MTATNDIAAAAIATTPTTGAEARLRLVLRVNALNSIASGVLMAAAPNTVDELLDTGRPGWIRLVGLGLIGFAAFVAWLSTGSAHALKTLVPQVVVGDVGWVVASVVSVLLGWYSGGGNVAVLAMAAVVDVFATLQWLSWRRLSSSRVSSSPLS